MKFIRNKLLRLVIIVFMTVVVVYVLWQFGSHTNLLGLLKSINPIIVILAFLLYFLTLLVKALRFRFILKNKISIKRLLSIVSIHSFWNNVLPFRSGELTYLYMVNEEKEVSNGENVISLLLARVFDLLTVLIFFLVSGFFIFHRNSDVLASVSLVLAVSILAASVAILLVVIFYQHKLSDFFSGPSFKNLFLNKIARIMSETFQALNQINNIRRLIIFTGLSFSVWILDALFIWVILLSAGFKFLFVEAIFIGIFPALVSLIPINLIGNFGVFEGAVIGGLILLNVDIKNAFDLSIILHTQTILFSLLLFLCAFLYRRIKK